MMTLGKVSGIWEGDAGQGGMDTGWRFWVSWDGYGRVRWARWDGYRVAMQGNVGWIRGVVKVVLALIVVVVVVAEGRNR